MTYTVDLRPDGQRTKKVRQGHRIDQVGREFHVVLVDFNAEGEKDRERTVHVASSEQAAERWILEQ